MKALALLITLSLTTVALAQKTDKKEKQPKNDGKIVGIIKASTLTQLNTELVKYTNQENENLQDAEQECRAVEFRYHKGNETGAKCQMNGYILDAVFSPLFGESPVNCKGSRLNFCHVEVICYPRNFKQKQILSLQRACETEAKEECFDSKFLDYLGELQSTTFTKVNESACKDLIKNERY